ncbi:TetR/AcrR family transcriptional regulator [Vannielia litorea]|uniref:Transcriptional regulator, TetR family n=1 Tax=Vannielia litorea TaxID=1217970 RepID=A0A1N6G3P3_9RHOB|nr:TetR/AcrR family transcriptional regulator [Vannielia litorea]SIO02159.1 transcriptional regulator, TetR family [Vannielia litorea]
MARPIAADHEEKREHILLTAARVFAEGGYDRASMAQVARACGVSKALIYHYYDSKEALLFDILDVHLKRLRDRIRAVEAEEAEARPRLIAMLRVILRDYEGADHKHQLQMNALATLPEPSQAVLKDYQRDMVRRLSAALAALAPPELAASGARLRDVTMSVFGMLNWFHMWQPHATPEARDDYAGLVAALALDGLKGVPPAPAARGGPAPHTPRGI